MIAIQFFFYRLNRIQLQYNYCFPDWTQYNCNTMLVFSKQSFAESILERIWKKTLIIVLTIICKRSLVHAYMVVIMQARLSSCQNGLHCQQDCLHVGMFFTVLIMVVYLSISSCFLQGCLHASIVVIIPAQMSSCQHGCLYDMAVIIPSWLLSCTHGFHQVIMVVIMQAWLSSCQNGLHCQQDCLPVGMFFTVLIEYDVMYTYTIFIKVFLKYNMVKTGYYE